MAVQRFSLRGRDEDIILAVDNQGWPRHLGYLGRIANLPGIDQADPRLWLLKAPSQTQFRIIIEEPAIKYGYRFEEAIDDGKPEHKEPLLTRLQKER